MKHYLLLLCVGCSGLAPATDTHESVFDWACLRTGPADTSVSAGPRVTYTVPVVDFDSQLYAPTTVPGAQLTVCTSASCAVPFTDYQGGPGANGLPFLWSLSFPAGVDNVTLRFSAPGYVPMDYALGGPLVHDAVGVGIPLVSETTLAALYSEAGLPSVDPARGTYAARVLNCLGDRAADVTLATASAAPGVPFSLSNDNLASRGSLETDARGVAGFFALPVGTLDVGGTVDGSAIAEPSTVNVRAGTITLTEVRPTLGLFGQ